MTTTPLQSIAQTTASSPTPDASISWKAFKLESVPYAVSPLGTKIEAMALKGTPFTCVTNTEAGAWDCRRKFIQTLIKDVLQKCPMDESLTVISLGCGRLLTEYIVGKTLIEKGFRKISFLLVDPGFAFADRDDQNEVTSLLTAFRSQIESAYLDKYKEALPQNCIKYLPRAQLISNHFFKTSNVILIESLPPYSSPLKEMQERQIEPKKPEEVFAGNFLVPPSHANAIAFLAQHYNEKRQPVPIQRTGSLSLEIIPTKFNSFYCFDWGCKIRPDGTYCLSFPHASSYLHAFSLKDDEKMELPGAEVSVLAKNWIPAMEKAIKKEILQETQKLEKPLSQQKISDLLNKVRTVAQRYMPGMASYFLADYTIDREEAMKYISAEASHHYRMQFALLQDIKKGYRIEAKQIP